MRKKFVFLLVAIMFVMSGCNGKGGNADKDKKAVEKVAPEQVLAEAEKMYAEIDNQIARPGSRRLVQEHEFTAMILSEPIELNVDQEDRTYLVATISRRLNQYFLLDITDTEDYPSAGEVIKLAGTVDTVIYWNEKIITSEQFNTSFEKQEQLLGLKLNHYELSPPEQVEPASEKSIATRYYDNTGTIAFLNAHFIEEKYRGDWAVVYFNFTNTGEKETDVMLNRLWFTFGDEVHMKPKNSTFKPEEQEPGAINGLSNYKVQPGETVLCYVAFKVRDGNEDQNVIHIDRYDDDFNWTNSFEIPIAPSFAKMSKK